jgi:hypothetical protein
MGKTGVGKIVVTAVLALGAVLVSVGPATALSGPLQVTRYSSVCANERTPPVNVTATYRIHSHGNDRWSTVTLKASNGNSVHYDVFYQQFLNREVGTEVLDGDPLFEGTWYYIVGEADLSGGGYLISLPAHTTDVCQVLGADNT